MDLRTEYHRLLCANIIRINPKTGHFNFADGNNVLSARIAKGIAEQIGYPETVPERIFGQTAGSRFETETKIFLGAAFSLLEHIRPGKFSFEVNSDISKFHQYKHLRVLTDMLKNQKELQAAFGADSDYVITPDVVVARYPLSDAEINSKGVVIEPDQEIASHSVLRQANHPNGELILHASVSCKWTLRSDRAQNARTEALNLIRNRKGQSPKIAVVTAEPLPSRIASLALGTGDVDCVYHFALPELRSTLVFPGFEGYLDMLDMMVSSDRLKDISDLPLDLAL